jgi:hypothetical protein
VTEWISNVNIPSCQLLIGMGVPLHRIPDIRRLYGCDSNTASSIDFDEDPQIEPSGPSPAYFPPFLGANRAVVDVTKSFPPPTPTPTPCPLSRLHTAYF